MSPWQMAAIALAGVVAGAINTIVGSGTLITFPTLLAFGMPAVSANMSNSVGLVGGGISGTLGYRDELRGKGAMLRRLAPMSFVGAVVGALLLRVLPSAAFDAIVPALVAVGILLVVLGPWLNRRAAAAHGAQGTRTRAGAPVGGRLVALVAGIFVAGVYGGYFGAAQGIILMGVMSVLLSESLQEINAVKNVLGTIVNAVAALTFIAIAPQEIDWRVAGLIAAGSLLGGFLGAKLGRRLNPWVLRGFIVVVGAAAIINLVR